MSAYDNDPRVIRNLDGSLTVAVPCDLEQALSAGVPVDGDGILRITYDGVTGAAADEAIRSLIGDPQ